MFFYVTAARDLWKGEFVPSPILWHLGCGDRDWPLGWPRSDAPNFQCVNIDAKQTAAVDLVADVRHWGLLLKALGAPHRIAAEDVLEHFGYSDGLDALCGWAHCLAPGGELHVRTNDAQGLLAATGDNWPEYNRRLFADVTDDLERHRSIWDVQSLSGALIAAGLDIQDSFVRNANIWIYARKPCRL